MARSMQNRVAYQKRITKKSQMQHEKFPRLPSVDIPSLLKAHATITLPTSSLFKSAYRGPDELADTEYTDEELERWNGLPPYAEGLENRTRQWLSENVQNLSDAMTVRIGQNPFAFADHAIPP